MNHALIIEIPKNEATFQNNLVLCFGRIEHVIESCNNVSITLSILENVIRARVNPKTQTFRSLIELKPGHNDIVFNYCDITTVVTVKYEPRFSNLQVLPLYIICKNHDGHFQAPEYEDSSVESACRRITLGSKLLQTVFASQLNNYRTFVLHISGCTVFYSKLTVNEVYRMNKLQLWKYFAREIMQSDLGNACTKYLAFLGCTKFNGKRDDNNTHKDSIASTDGYVAYGGEALALLGTACLYTWPESLDGVEACFSDQTPVPDEYLNDSFSRGTLGGCFATTLGAALHELCHTFDLGHTSDGIMGRGFNNIQQVFQDTPNVKRTLQTDSFLTSSQLILLNYHRWFNNYVKDNRLHTLKFDKVTKIIKSTAGIRVVEVREGTDEFVVKYWVFNSRVLTYSFQILWEVDYKEEYVIVVEDNCGNILKLQLKK